MSLERRPSISNRQQIEEEAARQVAELASAGDCPVARARLAGWLAQGPDYGVAFARAQAAWESAARLRAAPPALGPEEVAGPAGRFEAMFMRRRAIGGLLAASFVAALSVISVQALNSVDRYRTNIGEQRTIGLADGSTMSLNTGSIAEVAFRDDRRVVRLLDGEALFNVARDPARPFFVEAGSATLRATGTRFNVRIRQDLVELTMLDGAVTVDDGGGHSERVIKAGGAAAIRQGAVAETGLDRAAVEQRTAWRANAVELDGATLAQAVEEFNRYRKTPLVIGDPRISSIRVGGRFRTDDADAFVEALGYSFGIRAVSGPDGSVLLVAAE